MKTKKDFKKHIRKFDEYDIIQAFKSMGNAYRMNILIKLEKNPKMTLDQITRSVGGDFKNNSFHTRKLFLAGLINKKYKGAAVQHTLSDYGKVALKAYYLFKKNLF
jgi:predicted transcriptional regulator